ncbi:MAG: ribonuclease R [Proteobacteria bacterium]|nr:ribonuclease R [Pseudomonadota bacterium]
MTKARHPARSLPTKAQLLEFIGDDPRRASRREIARAFGLGPAQRQQLAALLGALAHEGSIGRGRRRAKPLPATAMMEVIDVDADEADVVARPLDWAGDGPPPRVRLRRPERAIGRGDRVLARLRLEPDGTYIGDILRIIEAAPERVLGIVRGDRIVPTERKVKTEFVLTRDGGTPPRSGELVVAEVLPTHRLGLPQARIVERLGPAAAARAPSLIAIHNHDIPTGFAEAALHQAARATPAPLGDREDLRRIDLVTIDGEDARDFDDAVFAEPDPAVPGGFHLVVAIADVAWYVRPDDALDQAARERGNSVYFPDRVVPMLPERLSNDLCSLRPHEDRPCLAVHMWIDAQGRKRRHRFVRAMIHSAARLTYEAVQACADGRHDGVPAPAREQAIPHLYAAYHALAKARLERGTLELDLEERKVVLDADGRIDSIVPRPRWDSHRLIEEFMIVANVCAAETLEQKRLPCMYRVHEEPSRDKLDSLRLVLDGLGYRLAKGQVLKSAHFNRILEWAADKPYRHLVNELVLRSQSLAVYSPDNRGHFGLALRRYAHFTSPIRRYADLLVHRALIAGGQFGAGFLPADAGAAFADIATHLSLTERRAAAAERDAIDRYAAAWLADRVGAQFSGRISGVTRFGLFVALDGLGVDGLVPIRTLPNDFYAHDPARHELRGRRTRRVFTLGQAVEVRLASSDPTTGPLIFDLLDAARPARPEGRRKR